MTGERTGAALYTICMPFYGFLGFSSCARILGGAWLGCLGSSRVVVLIDDMAGKWVRGQADYDTWAMMFYCACAIL